MRSIFTGLSESMSKLRKEMDSSTTPSLAKLLRGLLFALWGVPTDGDPPPRVLLER